MKNEEVVNAKQDVIDCGEPKVLNTVTYEKDGKMITEETLEFREAEGRASTIKVTYAAGKPLKSVTFSASGHGSSAWCSYQVLSKSLNAQSYYYDFTSQRYSGDTSRTFSNLNTLPVPGPYEQVFMYKFLKYVRNSKNQTNPTRTYQWVRELRGSGTSY